MMAARDARAGADTPAISHPGAKHAAQRCRRKLNRTRHPEDHILFARTFNRESIPG